MRKPIYRIEGTAGILVVDSKDVLNSKGGKRQLEALKKLKERKKK